MNSLDIVHVVVDDEGEVVGVASSMENIQTGKAEGLQVLNFRLNAMQRVNKSDRPWVVYFKDADEDRPQVWPIKHGFPDDEATVHREGIEVVVYARDPSEAMAKVYGIMHFDSWDLLKDDWRQMQS